MVRPQSFSIRCFVQFSEPCGLMTGMGTLSVLYAHGTISLSRAHSQTKSQLNDMTPNSLRTIRAKNAIALRKRSKCLLFFPEQLRTCVADNLVCLDAGGFVLL
jgi:hypothetical protein